MAQRFRTLVAAQAALGGQGGGDDRPLFHAADEDASSKGTSASLTMQRERDAAVFALVEGHAGKGFAIAFDLLRDSSDAEDAVQEALARTCAHYGDLREPDALVGWFRRVLVNLCMRKLRRQRLFAPLGGLRRTSRDDHDPLDVDDLPASAGAALTMSDAASEPHVGDAIDAQRLLVEVTRLSPKQRAAVVLRYGHELSVAETASALGISTESVKTHLQRAMTRLRARMEDQR